MNKVNGRNDVILLIFSTLFSLMVDFDVSIFWIDASELILLVVIVGLI